MTGTLPMRVARRQGMFTEGQAVVGQDWSGLVNRQPSPDGVITGPGGWAQTASPS